MAKSVSVIVPVYNTEKYLPRCISSLLEQSYRNLEIILINDGSSDGSLAVCQQFAAQDKRIVLLDKENGGVSSARNLGLQAAQGDYISIIDSDDWLENNCFYELLEIAEREQADIIYFEYFVNHDNGYQRQHTVDSSYYGKLSHQQALQATITSVNPFACSKLFSREAIADLRFREDIHWGEDSLFVCSALDQSRNIFFSPKPYYHYLQSEDSATRMKINPKRLSGLLMADEVINICLHKYPQLLVYGYYLSLRISSELLYQYYEHEIDDRNTIALLLRRVRKTLPKIILSQKISIRQRIKFLLAAINPRWYCTLHKKTIAQSKTDIAL